MTITKKIDKQWMPEKTRILYEKLEQRSQLKDAVLIGGTALSLQIGHRLSEDLDFAYFTEKLPRGNIQQLLHHLRTNGSKITPLISQSRISQARINGIDLMNYVQDYNVDGAKLTFFTYDKGGKLRKNYFSSVPKINIGATFKTWNIHHLFESKCVVLRDRVKSRDLYDLMYLSQNFDYGIQDIYDAIEKIDNPDEGIEPIKEILIGNVPFNPNDPGLSIINTEIKVSNIYDYFSELINQYEIEQAHSYDRSSPI